MKFKRLLPLSTVYLFLACLVFPLGGWLAQAAPTAYAADPAYVRVIHASPDIGTADVFLDGSKVLSNFEFGTVTHYVQIPPGPHKVQVALIGRGAGASIITQTLTVQPGLAYTVAALGTQAQGFKLIAFVDNNQVSTGKTKLRVYNLSQDTDLQSVNNGGSTLVSGISYQEATNYITLQAGSSTFTITTTPGSTSTPVSLDLSENTITSIFAIGLTAGTPKLRFVSSTEHAVPGVPSTGSDPNPALTSSPAQSTTFDWVYRAGLLGALLVGSLLLFAVRRKVTARF